MRKNKLQNSRKRQKNLLDKKFDNNQKSSHLDKVIYSPPYNINNRP